MKIQEDNEIQSIFKNSKLSLNLKDKTLKLKEKNNFLFSVLFLFQIVNIVLFIMIIKKMDSRNMYGNKESYLHRVEKNDKDNLDMSSNNLISEAKNNYEKIIMKYSNVSTGYHTIYNSSFNYQKFQNDLVSKLHLGGFDEVETRNIIERTFLNGLICFFKPKKILEIGVSKGGSSAIILNAIQNIEDAFLYSMDLNKMHYYLKNKKTGFIIEEKYPNLKKKWKLYTGDLPCKFIEEVGGNIDFVFIDTAHQVPGELLNFIEIFPFLKKNALVVIHDIDMIGYNVLMSSCDRLFAVLKGIKIIPIQENDNIVENMGAVILDDDIYGRVFDIFFSIYSNWNYIPSENQVNDLMNHIKKYYGIKYLNLFKEAIQKNIKGKRKIKRN